ncbi:MAG: TlpA family protein disulfide reductase [Cytophagales bacterium]|nr:TlpA family protein disulfide reductase [Rhizobacter sp.]
MKSIRHLAAGFVVLAIGAAAAFFYLGRPEMAPDAAFTRMDGTPARIGQLKGKVVLVNFWATTCVTCVKEMPQMVATHQKFSARGYETLAVAMSYDPPISVVSFSESRKLPFIVVLDNTGSIARSFGGVALTPTSVLIDKRGQIVKRYVGEPDFAALHKLVESLLAET